MTTTHRDLRVTARPRSVGLLLVAAAHAALAWLLMQGLGLRLSLETPPQPIQARMFDEKVKPVEPVAPPEPRIDQSQQLTVAEPDLQFEVETAPSDGDIAATIAEPGPTTIVTPEPRRSGVAIDARHPLTQPPYPAQSVRLEEQGSVTIEVRVAVDGRVREARVLQSSGYPRLDAAALEEARKIWRLRPATENDTPIEAWYAVRVSFRLDQR